MKTSLAGAVALMAARRGFAAVNRGEEMSPGRLSLYNTHNGERLSVAFRDAAGNYDLDSLNSLNWILRCHFTNEATTIDANTLEFLSMVDKRLGGDNEIHIISGYRSPRYNTLLRSNGRGVASKSLHLSGRAVDIAIPGQSLEHIRKIALDLRMGGVGYYPGAGFVHLDSGAVRTW
jgi:uncharacterized protein YcbK (DUF882 family)